MSTGDKMSKILPTAANCHLFSIFKFLFLLLLEQHPFNKFCQLNAALLRKLFFFFFFPKPLSPYIGVVSMAEK